MLVLIAAIPTFLISRPDRGHQENRLGRGLDGVA